MERNNFKKDLNLLVEQEPDRKKSTVRALKIAIIAVIVCLVVGGAIFFLEMARQGKEADLAQMQENIAQYQDDVAAFEENTALLQELSGQLSVAANAFPTNQEARVMMQLLESATPASITYTDVSINPTGITLKGESASDREVSLLAVNLRKSGIFQTVSIVSSTMEFDSVSRNFELYLLFPVVEEVDASANPEVDGSESPSPTEGGTEL
ncbi:MAG: PilN domain-containing protein [Christensenellales bacterium]|jgi:Tfp pilus assembly protein PilN